MGIALWFFDEGLKKWTFPNTPKCGALPGNTIFFPVSDPKTRFFLATGGRHVSTWEDEKPACGDVVGGDILRDDGTFLMRELMGAPTGDCMIVVYGDNGKCFL